MNFSMKKLHILLSIVLVLFLCACEQKTQVKNKVVGTWKPVKVVLENNGKHFFPFGQEPKGMLSFTPNMRFVEFIIDSKIPPFKSEVPGEGTDEENKTLIQGSFALYGTYSVDKDGNFTGDIAEGSSFPNWVGDVRTNKDLTMEVKGDTMIGTFRRPGGDKIIINWERLK